MVFWPSTHSVMANIVPNYINGIVYGCLVEAYCSEHNARMQAMQNATDSATDMLNELNAAYSNGCAGRLVIIEKESAAPAPRRPEIMSTCERIEQLLKRRLNSEDSTNYIDHLANADTFSSMADRGCAENADMYKAMALRELEIATALQPTENMRQRDAAIVIDTFKKLDMQQEAREFLDKIEQLIDPATDFILQMEQIINE